MLFQSEENVSGYLTGQLLIAMPAMNDPRFHKAVIFVCVHNQDGAMGLVLNRPIAGMNFKDLLHQLDMHPQGNVPHKLVNYGGPVEPGRGFVLHSTDFREENTLIITDDIGLTATVDVLELLSQGTGPRAAILALGYAGWGPGQLDSEMHNNGWLTVQADDRLIFNTEADDMWEKAMAKIGISVAMLSADAGHA
jgi:putative transcriptional regulator